MRVETQDMQEFQKQKQNVVDFLTAAESMCMIMK